MCQDRRMVSMPWSRVFWWVILALSASVVIATLLLMWFSDAGNWFTVIGSACSSIVSIGFLRALSIERRRTSGDQPTDHVK